MIKTRGSLRGFFHSTIRLLDLRASVCQAMAIGKLRPLHSPQLFAHMKTIHSSAASLLAILCFTLASCTPGGRSPSGFLGNYRQLDAGYGTADVVAAYSKPGVDLKKYDSVIIDPVTTVIASPDASPAVKDQLAAYLGSALQSEAASGLKIVSTPGPTTLRVRTALTDVIEGADACKPVTTIHTAPRATLSGKLGSPQLAALISHVNFEGEVLDSTSGERLFALSDHRIGTKREATADTSWAAVRSATNQGAAKLWQRYTIARGN